MALSNLDFAAELVLHTCLRELRLEQNLFEEEQSKALAAAWHELQASPLPA